MKYRYQSLWTLLAKLNDTSNIVAIRFDDPQGHPDAPSGLVASGTKRGSRVGAEPPIQLLQRQSASRDVGSLGPFLSLSGGVFHCLTFLKRLESTTADVRVMDKQVLTAIVRHDESKTLAITEPFYCSLCHVLYS